MARYASPVPDEQLMTMLRDLLSAASSGGEQDPYRAADFVGALLRRLGITDLLHEDGMGAAQAVPTSPAGTLKKRQERAYHLTVLYQVLLLFGHRSGEPTFFPADFAVGVLVSDLRAMLRGPGGLGEAEPQLLTTGRKGKAALRRHARQRLVGFVIWRAAHPGEKLIAVREALLPQLDKAAWDKWLKEVGGAEGELARGARAAGEVGDVSSPYVIPDSQLPELIALAMSGQRRSKAE
jgi:hypothetical protein